MQVSIPVRKRPSCLARLGAGVLALLTVSCLGSFSADAEGRPQSEPPEKAVKAGSANAAKVDAPKVRPGNLVGHGGPIKAIAVDPGSSRALTGSFDYTMMAWDLSGPTPRLMHRLADHDGAVNAVAFLPGARRALAAGDDGRVALWDLETAKLVARFEGHTAKIVGLTVSPDGRLAVSSSWDRTARVWNLETREPGPVLDGHTGPVNAAVFAADGRHVYTASYDGTIALHDAVSGTFVRPVYRHGWGINVLARLPNSERLVFGALNGSALVIDSETGETIAELPACERPILSLAVVEKPGLIALGGGDGLVRLIRMDDWSLLNEHVNPFGPVWALAFTPGATQMYYGGLDDFATLWQIIPRQGFEPIDSAFPRRFQRFGATDDPLAEGELQFARKCSVCHTLEPDGKNRAGPTLNGVLGRRIGTVPGYPYSDALKRLDIVWTAETVEKLFEFGPEVFTPGSKMPLQKMTDARQRAALIAYIAASGGAGGQVPPAIGPAAPFGQETQRQGEKK